MRNIKNVGALLLVILSIVFTTPTYAKKGTTAADQIEQVVSDGTKVVGNAIDSGKAAVKTGIAVVDTGLKVGAEHVYVVLVRQQFVYALSHLFMVIILFVLGYVLYRQCRKSYTTHLTHCGHKPDGTGVRLDEISIEDSGHGIATIVLGFSTAMILFIALLDLGMGLDSIISGLVNPEYGAMKEIVGFVKTAAQK